MLVHFRQVNEIYRDLANIVEQQQEAVEEIETNTEGAHARAQEGLVQVCFLSAFVSKLLQMELAVVFDRFSGSSLVDRAGWLLHENDWLSREGLLLWAGAPALDLPIIGGKNWHGGRSSLGAPSSSYTAVTAYISSYDRVSCSVNAQVQKANDYQPSCVVS